MRVLVCDPDDATRRLLSRILIRDFNCTVTECTDGLEALEYLSRQRCDLLIVELALPTVDGMEVLESIRATATTAALPVVVLTSIR